MACVRMRQKSWKVILDMTRVHLRELEIERAKQVDELLKDSKVVEFAEKSNAQFYEANIPFLKFATKDAYYTITDGPGASDEEKQRIKSLVDFVEKQSRLLDNINEEIATLQDILVNCTQAVASEDGFLDTDTFIKLFNGRD